MEHDNPVPSIKYLKTDEQRGTGCSMLVVYAHHLEREADTVQKLLHSLALMTPSLLNMLDAL